jgi:signal transduction histidine kinase
MLSFVILSAIFISKLAIDPLSEHVINLQNLSKETLHELNLPIATIKTNLSMLKKNQTDEKTLKRLSRIEEATKMLQQRYDELDYLIKTQTIKRIQEEFNIKELLEKRVDFFKSIYPSNNFILDAQSKILKNDIIGLSKVIDNIIDNSVKYSPKNSKIIITFKNNTLSIKDEGKGIEEVELIRIFDSFYQEDSSKKGFGIGLFMVKKFCDNNNIELNIKSKVGIGTTVELKFKD